MGRVKELAAGLAAALLVGCAPAEQPAAPRTPPQAAAQPSQTSESVEREGKSRADRTADREPPAWLGTRPLPVGPDGLGIAAGTPPALRERAFTLPDTVPPLPGRGFASRVRRAPESVLARSTWQPGCPVDARDLAWVRLTFWGFDDARHTGELLVAASVADDVVSVFRALYAARFPIEEMRVTRRDELDAPPTGDGNNTGGFVCRPAVGQSSYSQHAYGLAVDVNPFQNPYVRGDGVVLPELASAYADRGRARPGMVLPGSEVVAAFARVGWEWGGEWQSLKDYMHFSLSGR